MGKKSKVGIESFMRELIRESLHNWFNKEDWVRITTSGDITGPCGTSKNKKNPDRCLPRKKAESLSKSERAASARKKKNAGSKGKTVVKNTKKAKVTKEDVRNLIVGLVHEIKQEYVLSEEKEKDDRCKRIAKQKYDTWPSAYASGAVVRCRKGEIWQDLSEDQDRTISGLRHKNFLDTKTVLKKLQDGIKYEMARGYNENIATRHVFNNLWKDIDFYDKLI